MATQQEINDFVEQIMPYFDPAPVEEDTVQQSWPRLDRGLSDLQDMTRFQQMKGVLARGGRPFWLRGHATDAETDAARTLFLTVSTWTGVAEATMAGVFYRMRDDIELSLPAVSTPTMHYVVLEYDPIRSESGGHPIEAKVVTSLSKSQGRDYLVLWEGELRPSQLLSQVQWQMVRPFVGGVITVNYASQLPDPNSVTFGTIGISRLENTVYYSHTKGEDEEGNSNSEWVNLLDPEWRDNLLNVGYEWQGFGKPPQTQKSGNSVKVRGTIKLSSGGAFQAGNAYRVIYLPGGRRPSGTRYFVIATSNANQPDSARATIDPDGAVYVRVSRSCAWISLDGIQFDID